MTITKLGHCCLLIEDQGKVIMTDPGAWSTAQNEVQEVDIILITHEHPDHFHVESLKTVLANNPQAIVVTNSRVSELLAQNNIAATLLQHEQKHTFENLEIAGFGTEHANIYPALPNVMNTGFLIQDRFFYAGDAFTNPGVAVEILGMPMIAPWMKLAESIEWALTLKPRVCLPVHDGMLQPREWIYGLPAKILPEAGIQFDAIELGKKKGYT
jgi:L-ascorbate metabolism protein UlaG (beta-lactamase superfamily)